LWFLAQWSSALWPLHPLSFIPEAHGGRFERDWILLGG
jgi:hypothetical protein